MQSSREWDRALIVEDDCRFAEELRRFLEERGTTTCVRADVQGALQCVQEFRPTLVLLDFQLADGNARAFLEGLRRITPWPYCIAFSGQALAADAFELARLGVRKFLPKPFHPRELQALLDCNSANAAELVPALRSLVGVESVTQVEDLVRQTMVSEALTRCEGNRSAAARLLDVSRQMLQHIVRGLHARTID